MGGLQNAKLAGRGALAPLAIVVLLVAGCAETGTPDRSPSVASADIKSKGRFKIGKPYQIKGVWYYPGFDHDYEEVGIASWYGEYFHGRATANGEIYNMDDLTAAHATLPLPSIVRVTNLENNKSLELRVNDRGPFHDGRVIDVSRRAAQVLGFERTGTTPVKVEILADKSRRAAEEAHGGPLPPELANPTLAATGPRSSAPPAVALVADSGDVDRVKAPIAIAAPVSPPQRAPAPVVVAAPTVPMPGAKPIIAKAEPVTASSGRLFVQAGAFSEKRNAERVRSDLSSIGPADIAPARITGHSLFRVRVGPVRSNAEADRLLSQVVRAGYRSSKIVAD